MKKGKSNSEKNKARGPVVLVAVDFSHCSRLALRKAMSLAPGQDGRVLVLHVIDQSFVNRCIRQKLGSETEIKKQLFKYARAKLSDFLSKEGVDKQDIEMIVCEGIPFIEINKKAVETEAEMIVMGSKGNSNDLKTIFFGSTTERVLRFIKRPVLCVPP